MKASEAMTLIAISGAPEKAWGQFAQPRYAISANVGGCCWRFLGRTDQVIGSCVLSRFGYWGAEGDSGIGHQTATGYDATSIYGCLGRSKRWPCRN